VSSEAAKSKMTGEKIRNILIKRSNKALVLAQRQILAHKVQSNEARSALEYYVVNWKEAIHPGLMNFVSEAVGSNSEKVLDLQVSMLMFATAIDIHDDIIDNSIEKYGELTVFGKFGRDIAILLGNAFMVEGFTLLYNAVERLPTKVRKEVFNAIRSALFEIGNAHALELRLKGRWDADPEEYFAILEKKGAIIEAEARISSIVGGGTKREIEALSRYGRILGLLGTLREEFVDIFEIQELVNRIKNECLPIPVMYAIQDKKARERIQDIFSKKEIKEKDLTEVIGIVFHTKMVRELKETMSKAIKEAINKISILRKTDAKLFLGDLVKSMLEDL
jgi:geranylgeranyl pyrophosphate synthase